MLAQASGDVAFDKALSPAIADLAVSAMAYDLARGHQIIHAGALATDQHTSMGLVFIVVAAPTQNDCRQLSINKPAALVESSPRRCSWCSCAQGDSRF
jgi:hypothetical protein